jgi:hypothetical protein
MHCSCWGRGCSSKLKQPLANNAAESSRLLLLLSLFVVLGLMVELLLVA